MKIIGDISVNFLSLYMEMSFYIIFGLLIAGFLHLFLTRDFIAAQTGKNNFSSVLKSLLIGIPMPICSCSVIPAAVFLSKNGSSPAAVTAFLIATPQTGADSIIATFGMMGAGFAVFRPLAALITGVSGGAMTIISRQPPYATDDNDPCRCGKESKNPLFESIGYAFGNLFSDLAKPFLTGLLAGSVIISFLPENLPDTFPFLRGISGLFIILILSIPMYICATSSIPVAISLMAAGFSPGTAFVFLTAGPATNIASIIVIAKTLGRRTAATYLSTIIIFSIFLGMLIDQLPPEWFTVEFKSYDQGAFRDNFSIPLITASLIMTTLYIRFFYSLFFKKNPQNQNSEQTQKT